MLLEDGDHGVVGVDALRDGGRAGLGIAAAPVPAPVAASAAAALVLPIRPPPASTAATTTSARATFKVSNTVRYVFPFHRWSNVVEIRRN